MVRPAVQSMQNVQISIVELAYIVIIALSIFANEIVIHALSDLTEQLTPPKACPFCLVESKRTLLQSVQFTSIHHSRMRTQAVAAESHYSMCYL